MIKARGLKLILQFFRLYFEKVTHTKVSRNILNYKVLTVISTALPDIITNLSKSPPKKGVKNRMETGIGRNPPPFQRGEVVAPPVEPPVDILQKV